jgi:FkbM family methyltransferase
MNSLRDVARKVPGIRRLRRARDLLLRGRDKLGLRSRDRAADPAPGRGGGGGFADRFYNYDAAFDPQEVMRRHAVPDLAPRPGFLTNFLGVVIDPKFFPSILDERAGQVEGIPIPANWHADIAEWGAALRAVDLARRTFTVVELGCGWGCWLNNTGVAARRAGLDVRLIGVEGDKGHVQFAREACAANGFSPSQVTLHNAVAAANPGIALFPKQEKVGMAWGLEPVFGATEAQRQEAVRTGEYYELPMIALDELARDHPRIDLLHVDIQGGEADLVAGTLDLLRAKVACLLVGTHSRQIEGRLFEMLLGAGWRLEIERPAILAVDGAAVGVTVDGVQGWRNPALLP